jgi:hypothetical protein
MSIFNFSKGPKQITVDAHKSVLQGLRDLVTGQAVLRTETDAESHRKFIAEYVAALKPDGMIEIRLAQRLAPRIPFMG